MKNQLAKSLNIICSTWEMTQLILFLLKVYLLCIRLKGSTLRTKRETNPKEFHFKRFYYYGRRVFFLLLPTIINKIFVMTKDEHKFLGET